MAKGNKDAEIVTELDSMQGFTHFLTSRHGLIVCECFQDWAGPCVVMRRFLRKAKFDMDGDDPELVSYCSIKVEAVPAFKNLRGHCIPTYLFFGGKKLVHIFRGYQPSMLMPIIKEMVAREKLCMAGKAKRNIFSDAVPYVIPDEDLPLPDLEIFDSPIIPSSDDATSSELLQSDTQEPVDDRAVQKLSVVDSEEMGVSGAAHQKRSYYPHDVPAPEDTIKHVSLENEKRATDVVQKDPEVNFNQSGKEVRESPTIGSLRASQQQQETLDPHAHPREIFDGRAAHIEQNGPNDIPEDIVVASTDPSPIMTSADQSLTKDTVPMTEVQGITKFNEDKNPIPTVAPATLPDSMDPAHATPAGSSETNGYAAGEVEAMKDVPQKLSVAEVIQKLEQKKFSTSSEGQKPAVRKPSVVSGGRRSISRKSTVGAKREQETKGLIGSGTVVSPTVAVMPDVPAASEVDLLEVKQQISPEPTNPTDSGPIEISTTADNRQAAPFLEPAEQLETASRGEENTTAEDLHSAMPIAE